MLSDVGVNVPLALADDVIIRAGCINEHLPVYSLDFLCKKYLGEGKLKIDIDNIAELSNQQVREYAVKDAELTLRLWEWQQGEIRRQGIEDICAFERRVMPSFIRAELRGVRVDLRAAEKAADDLTPIIDGLQAKLGEDLNVNSPKQLKELFAPREVREGEWQTDAGEPIGTTPKGGPSLKAEFLRELNDPRATSIIELRSLLKTRDTFLRKHILEHSISDRVYPTINQSKNETAGTGTGRLSYTGPALQQIPSRNKDIAAIVKPCFLPDEGQVWVAGDMASFEVRIFAHLVNNPHIIQAYKDDPELDFHQYVADISNLPRNARFSGEANAKQMNLSMIFNSGNGAIAHKMGMPSTMASFLPRGKIDIPENWIIYRKAGPEAEAVIKEYHLNVRGVKQLAKKCTDLAKRTGYVFTYTGRRLRFPHGYKVYKASGLLIQATAADRNKENWMKIEEALGDEGHMILNTHDDYNLSLPRGKKGQALFAQVKESIEEPRFKVPLVLDYAGTGENWWKAISKS